MVFLLALGNILQSSFNYLPSHKTHLMTVEFYFFNHSKDEGH